MTIYNKDGSEKMKPQPERTLEEIPFLEILSILNIPHTKGSLWYEDRKKKLTALLQFKQRGEESDLQAKYDKLKEVFEELLAEYTYGQDARLLSIRSFRKTWRTKAGLTD